MQRERERETAEPLVASAAGGSMMTSAAEGCNLTTLPWSNWCLGSTGVSCAEPMVVSASEGTPPLSAGPAAGMAWVSLASSL